MEKIHKKSFKIFSPFTYTKPDVVCLNNNLKSFALPNVCAVYS